MFLFLDRKYIEKNEYFPVCSWFLHERIILSRQSGYFYLNKGKYNLNLPKDDFLLNGRPRTIAETMRAGTKFMRFS